MGAYVSRTVRACAGEGVPLGPPLACAFVDPKIMIARWMLRTQQTQKQ